jgi:hypothetical protein
LYHSLSASENTKANGPEIAGTTLRSTMTIEKCSHGRVQRRTSVLAVPLNERVDLFADGRMMLGAEAEELLAVAPIRAGLTWRF